MRANESILKGFEPAQLDTPVNAIILVDVSRIAASGGEDPTMIPDYLIIEEIRRRQQDTWEPEPLRLPLYTPQYPERQADEEEEESKSRVIIIDM